MGFLLVNFYFKGQIIALPKPVLKGMLKNSLRICRMPFRTVFFHNILVLAYLSMFFVQVTADGHSLKTAY